MRGNRAFEGEGAIAFGGSEGAIAFGGSEGAIARLLPNMQRIIVGRFRNWSDADGHLQ